MSYKIHHKEYPDAIEAIGETHGKAWSAFYYKLGKGLGNGLASFKATMKKEGYTSTKIN